MIKDYQRISEIVKGHFKEYLIENGYEIKGNKVQCINTEAHEHGDKNKLSASFVGIGKKKIFCFVENRAYDIFDLYTRVTGKDTKGQGFFVALKFFCDKYKIPYEEVYAHSPKEIELSKKRKVLEELHKMSLVKDNLMAGKEYYQRRKLTLDKIKHFRIGFIKPEFVPYDLDSQFKTMFEYSIKKTLTNPGLVIPLFDEYNQYRAIIIRQFDVDEKSGTKYLNYSVSKKGLFNVNNVKSDEYVYIVEGTFDTIALYPENNVVGVLTNGVKAEDLEFFEKKNFKKIYVALDEDNSRKERKEGDGIYSTIMSLKNLEAEVFVIKLPHGTDPDEYITHEGIDAFHSLEKIPALKYLIGRYKQDVITTKELYEYVAGCPDVIRKENYITYLSKKLDVGKRALSREIDKFSDTDKNINLLDYAKEKDCTEELLEDFTETAWNNDFTTISSGYPIFDSKLGGFEDTIYMFIARPEMGKSLGLLAFTKNILSDPNNFVAFYSLDDGVKRAILPRLLAMITGLKSSEIRNPTQEIKDKWKEGVNKLRELKDSFVMKDGADIRTVWDLENFLKIHKHIADERNKKLIVIIDNIHCLTSSNKFEGTENMTRVAAFLKKVPQVYECPVITTAEVPKSAAKKPTGDDIKQTIDLWYAARCVIGVYNGMSDKGDTNLMWSSGDGAPEPVIEFFVSKNQTGETWHGSLFYKVRLKDNAMIECTEEEMEILKAGGMILQ